MVDDNTTFEAGGSAAGGSGGNPGESGATADQQGCN
jgi:hypothetical protein